MAERKVQNKYIPPDFDPKLLAKLSGKARGGKRTRDDGDGEEGGGAGPAVRSKEVVRVMLPFNLCCARCNAYMYRGRKFNARKEDGRPEEGYMGTKAVRFNVKCDVCSNPIVFRTNPKTSGFEIVSGARENATSVGRFNHLEGVPADADADKKDEGDVDAVAALEARAMASKKEMAVLDELEKQLERSRARAAVATAVASAASVASKAATTKGEEQDEARLAAEARRAFAARKRAALEQEEMWGGDAPAAPDDDHDDDDDAAAAAAATTTATTKTTTTTSNSLVPDYSDSDDDA